MSLVFFAFALILEIILNKNFILAISQINSLTQSSNLSSPASKMSNNKSAAEQQEEVSKAVSDASVDTAPASAVNPSPKKPTAEVEAGTGEESRDSVNSVGEDSAEGDEDEEAGDEEETDEEQQGEKAANGHHEKNGHQQQTEEGAEAELNGDAKVNKFRPE